LSTLTSTDFSAVPSLRTTPRTVQPLPVRVTRAMNDFNCIREIEVSFHFTSPSIRSPSSLRYQRACHLPR
jgi:hypothetical protein